MNTVEIDPKVIDIKGVKVQELKSKEKNEYSLETKCLIASDGQPAGSFRVVLMVESNAWKKGIIVGNVDRSNSFIITAGDNSGKVFPQDGTIKYAAARFNFSDDKSVKFEFQKAKNMGALTTLLTFIVAKPDRPKFDGKTIILYYQNNNSGKFSSVQDLTKLPLPAKDLL